MASKVLLIVALFALIFAAVNAAIPPSPISFTREVTWYNNFIANLKWSGTDAIVAARSKAYDYDWVRDSALCMKTLMKINKLSAEDRIAWYERYFRWTKLILNQSGNPGYDIRGDVKFFTNGNVYNGNWGRNQNDGPAFRSIVLLNYADEIMKKDNGKTDNVMNRLYYPSHNATSGIQYDLDYVADNYKEKSFELWEEVNGNHFGILLASRGALTKGAVLANKLGDSAAAARYNSVAEDISKILNTYYDECRNIIVPTFNYDGNSIAANKNDLDIAIFLNSMYGTEDIYKYKNPISYNPVDERVLATLIAIENSFASEYYINKVDNEYVKGVNYGRYPNDIYDGYGTSKGNPWFLATAAAAEMYYLHAFQMQEALVKGDSYVISNRLYTYIQGLTQYVPSEYASDFKSIVDQIPEYSCSKGMNGAVLVTLTDKQMKAFAYTLVSKGDETLRRLNRHVNEDSALSEQYNRDTGIEQGVEHLTWSYANLLSTLYTRSLLTKL